VYYEKNNRFGEKPLRVINGFSNNENAAVAMVLAPVA